MLNEVIKVGQLEIKFLMDAGSTAGAMSVFELVVPAGARVPLPHYHQLFDEALYVLEGIITFTIAGQPNELHPGQSCFIPKGVIHGFNNLHSGTVKALSIITPALLGADYFVELGHIVNAGGPPDVARVNAVMQKHGLVAVPPKA